MTKRIWDCVCLVIKLDEACKNRYSNDFIFFLEYTQGHRMDQNVNLKIFYTSTHGILVSTYKEKALKHWNLRNQFKL